MHDLVIDNARIVDGTGAPPRQGSVAVSGGRIVEVGGAAGQAARERVRRRRARARPWLHRSPHALRRAARLGPARDVLVVARHHHGGHRQLRRAWRPAGPTRARS